MLFHCGKHKVPQETISNLRSLHEAWRGLRDEELSQCAGIEGCTFVHASGFTGGHKTREGALLMVQKSIAAVSAA